MDRDFSIGNTVLCTESGVVGVVLSFYTPKLRDEQTKVLTDDGRKYHAPTRTWVKFNPHENNQQCVMDFANISRSNLVMLSNKVMVSTAKFTNDIMKVINRSDR